MSISDFHLAPSKMNKYLKVMIAMEALLLFGAYGIIMGMFSNIERQKTERSIQQMNYTLTTNIRHTLDMLDTLTKAPISSDSYAAVPTLWSYLISPAKQKENPYKFEALFIDKYHQMNLLFPQMNAFFIFDPHGKVLSYKYNNIKYFMLDNLSEEEWLASLKESGGELQLYQQEKLDSIGYTVDAKVLYAGRWLYDIYSSQPAVIVIIGINISDIYTSFESQKLFETQEFACFDHEGTMLFASDGMQEVSLQQILHAEENSEISYQVNYDKTYQIYSVIGTERKDIAGISFYLKLLFFLLIPVIIIFNLIVAMTITKNVVRSYNKMTEEVYQKTISEKDLNLQMLRSQINPHFLYNTLDSIIWMAEWGKNQEVVRMTSSLAKLLRRSISNEQETVTVAEEVEYTETYLTIQKMRYKDKLEYEIQVEPEILQENVIKLILQPLVENAIYHGIKYKEGKGMVRIEGFREGEHMILRVRDDGKGMDSETLAHIFEKHTRDTRSNGVGLNNVNERIQIYYGEDYGISFKSSPGKGTEAAITLPFGKEEGSDEES